MSIVHKTKALLRDSVMRRRILITLGVLVLFRFLATIPIPGIDPNRIASLFTEFQFLNVVDIFSGGGLSQLSIIMLGVSPYITASIIMQLMTMVFPKLKAMYQEEGDAGRMKFGQYSRVLSVPLALIQGFSFLMLLTSQGVVTHLTPFDFAFNLVLVTAGSLLLMWLGELITEFGIGNGVSILIFAGIVASLPSTIARLLPIPPEQIPMYAGFMIAAIAVIYLIVLVTEAERPVPVTYAKQGHGGRSAGSVASYIPFRINQAGVIPIIFALSILLIPQMIGGFLTQAGSATIQMIGEKLQYFTNHQGIYAICYFILVFLFTYFYTAVTFDPKRISENLQKSGAFVPGVRPGEATAQHLGAITTRITLIGAIFLGVVAILPFIMQAITKNPSMAIGGTALLIVVSVVIDLLKRVDAQVSMREY